jgi:hypothetical protein
MAFATGAIGDFQKVAGGERFGTANVVLTATTFQAGLKTGRFAKLDAGSLDNLDGSENPVIAGVVLRNVTSCLEGGATVAATLYSQAEYLRSGLVTVDVKAGETPAKFGAVYASNTTGEATATNTDIATGAEFIEEVKSGVWLVRLK